MQTPKILAALANDRAAHNISQKFENALKAIEQGVADKKMYNADYENFKYWINEGCDKALDAAAEPWRELYRQGQRNIPYKESDPRFTIGYSVSPLHARGLLNRLKKYANEPAVAPYIAVLEEVAPVGELLKQLKPFIVKGRRPNENPVEVDNTNTGVCPVCLRRQKLTFDSKMVDHGYTVPHGWGGRNGHCLGFKHAPYELSSEGCVYFLSILKRQFESNKEYLVRLEKREVPEFVEYRRMYKGPGRWADETEVIKKGEPKYESKVQQAISKTEMEQEFLQSDMKRVQQLIDEWTLQPLKYGGPETQERWKSRLAPKP